ncbi:OOP family OmpA-OmpF porin [Kribbella antiqua]|uniref:OOP family OmpA-OmpF porin n=1 Tax=Kribbella antiqua TaxID=2512217 RepID=A0A4V2S3H3_9ACTN|nr:OmpA family protein [Kribbella antiqua]TCO44450.1 OOP family OmpA-OmpF porin [Kribbella antiqua]
MPGLVRRPLVVWLLAALAVPVLLTAVLIPAKAGTTEDELRDRTTAALQARGINGAEVDIDGRDATIAVPAGVDAGEVREVVAGVDGVRSVKVDGGTTESTPTPPPPAAIAPFEVGRTAQAIRVQAVVRDQAVKDAVAAEVGKVIDEGKEFDNRITVDAATGLPDASALAPLIQALAFGPGDVSARYDGTTITLTGQVADQAAKATAARAAAKAVPGAVVANELELPPPPKPEVSEACRTFGSRLAEFSRHNKIVFLSGTSIVNDASKGSVIRAAALLKTCTTARVEVAGHTDNLGSPATSLPLSQRRADAVKATLVRLGVRADRILAHGYGESFPVAPNTTAAGRIANRRAEIRVQSGP